MNDKVFGSDKKGSIRDIPLPQNQDHVLNLQKESANQAPIEDWDKASSVNKRRGMKGILLLVGVALLVFVYSLLFYRADIAVSAKTETRSVVGQEFTAMLASNDGLSFVRPNTFTKTESIYIEGSKQENRQTKSSGIITVFNSDSTDKNYIKNTRFQTEDGRIYRAFKRFVIPRGTADEPGSVDVLVVAETPGDKYNSESGLTFTLPALKEQGDDSYDKVYANQKEPLSGGYSGVVSVPSAEDIAEGEVRLQERLETSLGADFRAIMPENYVLDDSFIAFSQPVFTQEPDQERGGINLKATGELMAVALGREELAGYLASELLDTDLDTTAIEIDNIQDLVLTITSETDLEQDDTFDFTIGGDVVFIWKVDKAQLQSVVAGKLVTHIENGLVNGLDHVTIDDIQVRPFWRRAIPENTDKIDIAVTK